MREESGASEQQEREMFKAHSTSHLVCLGFAASQRLGKNYIVWQAMGVYMRMD